MKLCNKCGIWKDESEFAWKLKAKGTRNTQCKECHKEYSKGHYDNKKQYYVDKARVSNAIAYARNKEFVNNYLIENPCVDCGETDIEVLQFDHKEMVGSKGKRIFNYIKGSLEKLKEEIAKCEPRCGNCHIRKTRKQMGWYRLP